MINRNFLLVLGMASAFVMSAHVLRAQDGVKYREFELGGNLASVSKLTGVGESQAKIIRQRPAMLQDLEWRPRYFSRGAGQTADPVDRMVFSFYNDQLYKVVVDYDAHRTEGLKQADLVAAISATYGVAKIPKATAARPTAAQYGDSDLILASWGNAEYSLTLFRVSSYQNSFRLVVSSTRLTDLARIAALEAVRLDVLDAPQRELARQRKEVDDARTADEKARQVNLPAFTP